MKKFLTLSLFLLFALSAAVMGQDAEYSSSRLDNYANRLKRNTVDLADRTSDDLRRSRSVSRADIEAAFLAQQIDGSAGVFQQMVRDNMRASDLREAASLLAEIARRAPSFSPHGHLWRGVRDSIADINRELGGYGGGNPGGGDDRPVSGRVYWRGTVDDRVHLIIRDGKLETRTISGSPYSNSTFSFTSPLPNRGVSVEVDKKKGRGNVKVIQQPSRNNDFTAVIEIRDNDGGAREYQLDIFWR